MVSLVWQNLVRSPHQSRQNIKSVKIWRRHIIEQQHQPSWSFLLPICCLFFAQDITDHEGVTRRWGRWDNECLCPVRLPPTNLWTEFQIASTPASGPHHPLLSPHLLYFWPWMQRGGGDSRKWLQVVWLWTNFPNLRKGISNGFPRIGPPVMYQ